MSWIIVFRQLIVVQTQGVTPGDDRREKKIVP
jgi:hypothetical protein